MDIERSGVEGVTAVLVVLERRNCDAHEKWTTEDTDIASCAVGV